jgi:ankyrin repeat protein
MTSGADNTPDRNEITPLHFAAGRGDSDIVYTIIVFLESVDPVDYAGQTPLHWAAMNGRARVVRALVLAGADPHIQDFNRQTPFSLASSKGHHFIANLLLAESRSSSQSS